MRITCVTETFPPEQNGDALPLARGIRHLQTRHRVQVIRLRFGWATVGAVRSHLSETPPDLVHVATPGPLGRTAMLAAASLGLPLTTDLATSFHGHSRCHGLSWAARPICRFLRALHNRADCTFVPTRALARELGDEGFERLEVLGRGVDAGLFSPERRNESLRASWGANRGANRRARRGGSQADPPVLLYAGRLAADTNAELALLAHQRLRLQRPDAKLVVVGDGPLRPSLQARYPHALFAGAKQGLALAEHYASADLMLIPSESDQSDNVTLESLASGLEVVAFDAAAAAEHIVDGHNGWLVPCGAHEGFVATAVRVGLGFGMAGSRRLLRERARTQALQVTWDKVLDRFERRLGHHARETVAKTVVRAVAG